MSVALVAVPVGVAVIGTASRASSLTKVPNHLAHVFRSEQAIRFGDSEQTVKRALGTSYAAARAGQSLVWLYETPRVEVTFTNGRVVAMTFRGAVVSASDLPCVWGPQVVPGCDSILRK
jgi:hypothetical protein